MTEDATDIPGREQVLAVVWKLMQTASRQTEPDHQACAKYAELLLRRGQEKGSKRISDEFLAEIAQAK